MEFIFFLIIAYVAYVAYSIFKTKQTTEAPVSENLEASEADTASYQVAKKKVVETSKPVAKKAVKTKVGTKLASGNIRNPETGELVKMATSYQMSKRWIKEALVTEGLLTKIYKASEIDETVKSKIIEALNKLVAMKKYQ